MRLLLLLLLSPATTNGVSSGGGDAARNVQHLDRQQQRAAHAPKSAVKDQAETDGRRLVKKTELILTEVAYKGGGGVCEGRDWIEIFNAGSNDASLVGMTLIDDKGPSDDDAKTFTADDPNTVIVAGEHKVLCGDEDFDFGIGSDDMVTLLDHKGNEVTTSGVLPGTGSDDQTYAYSPMLGEWRYTSMATPGKSNIFGTLQDVLRLQHEEGKDFFRLHDDGTEKTTSSFPKIVDLYVEMASDDIEFMRNEFNWEEYRPFTDIRVIDSRDGKSHTVLMDGGEGLIRPKGGSTVIIGGCLGKSVPYKIKLLTNKLYGMTQFYLRSHFGDPSFMREYAINRLIARFGLPYLRSRHVRLFLNGEYKGLYLLMEAVNTPYVVQRSLGTYDPDLTAMYKFRQMTGLCPPNNLPMPSPGIEKLLESAKDAPVPEIYYFERGDHRDTIPILGPDSGGQCYEWKHKQDFKEIFDITIAYHQNDESCAKAYVNAGRIDRKVGPRSADDVMISFLEETFYSESVEQSKLMDNVDSDQWLKTISVYSVLNGYDSPLAWFLNNFYVASSTGGENDWKLVMWDTNNFLTHLVITQYPKSTKACGTRETYLPILRPNGSANEKHPILGPLLNNQHARQVYVSYVSELVELITDDFIAELRDYGTWIASFAAEDSHFKYSSITEYKEAELNPELDGFPGFLKHLEERKTEVQKQVDSISAGTLPRNGKYGVNEVCPDWRDNGDGVQYIPENTLDSKPDCSECAALSHCFGGSDCDSLTGEFTVPECAQAASCKQCFPYSTCGSFPLERTGRVFIAGNGCDPEALGGEENFGICKLPDVGDCFDNRYGICVFNGDFISEPSHPFCEDVKICGACYPFSNCGSTPINQSTPAKLRGSPWS